MVEELRENNKNSIQNKPRLPQPVMNIIEICLLFGVFFLPGYLSQAGQVSGALFNTVRFNLLYIISSIPQILLILYILLLRHRKTPPALYLPRYGIKPLKFLDFLKGLAVFAGIYAVIMIFYFAAMFSPLKDTSFLLNRVEWKIESPGIIPLVVISLLLTGYREEIFFRSYLITRLEQLKFPGWAAGIISAVLFSAGHVYQGWAGFFGTLMVGLYLSFLFLRLRNLHALAIAHGLYNIATILILSFLNIPH